MSKKKDQFNNSLKKNKIKKKIIDAMSGLARANFFEKNFKDLIYTFDPIPIGYG